MKTHLSRFEPREVERERVMMPVRAIPKANNILCHTTTSTVDNTWQQSLVDCREGFL